jgi:hypothetical protein
MARREGGGKGFEMIIRELAGLQSTLYVGCNRRQRMVIELLAKGEDFLLADHNFLPTWLKIIYEWQPILCARDSNELPDNI